MTLGTSICGMTSDEIPRAAAERFAMAEGDGLVPRWEASAGVHGGKLVMVIEKKHQKKKIKNDRRIGNQDLVQT